MNFDPTDIFGQASGEQLNPAEKAQGWQALQARMQEQAVPQGDIAPADEAMLLEFFSASTEVTLTAKEKAEGFQVLKEDREAAAFFAPAKQECLGAMERAAVLSALQGGMQAGETAPAVAEERNILGELVSAVLARWAAPAVAALVLVSAGAGISYASEQSLPGDFLYPIKQVNESIRTGLQFSQESKAEVQTERVGKRVKEAESLQKNKRLTDSVSSTLDTEFRLERRYAIVQIQTLETAGNAEAAARLRARLNAIEDNYQKLLDPRHHEGEEKAPKAFPTIQNAVSGSGLSSHAHSSRQSSQASVSSGASAGISVDTGRTSVKANHSLRLHGDSSEETDAGAEGEGSSSEERNPAAARLQRRIEANFSSLARSIE